MYCRLCIIYGVLYIETISSTSTKNETLNRVSLRTKQRRFDDDSDRSRTATAASKTITVPKITRNHIRNKKLNLDPAPKTQNRNSPAPRALHPEPQLASSNFAGNRMPGFSIGLGFRVQGPSFKAVGSRFTFRGVEFGGSRCRVSGLFRVL